MLKHVKALWSSLSWTPLCLDSSWQFDTVPHSSTLAGFYLVYLHTHGLAAWLLCYKGDSTKFHEMRTGMWDANWICCSKARCWGWRDGRRRLKKHRFGSWDVWRDANVSHIWTEMNLTYLCHYSACSLAVFGYPPKFWNCAEVATLWLKRLATVVYNRPVPSVGSFDDASASCTRRLGSSCCANCWRRHWRHWRRQHRGGLESDQPGLSQCLFAWRPGEGSCLAGTRHINISRLQVCIVSRHIAWYCVTLHFTAQWFWQQSCPSSSSIFKRYEPRFVNTMI